MKLLSLTKLKILFYLTKAWMAEPSLRFCQLLWNASIIADLGRKESQEYKIVDNFYMRDSEVLDKLKG